MSSSAATKRAQILMPPEEYAQLEALALQQRVSVAELIRRAVRERYLLGARDRRRLVDEICAMSVPLPDWEELEAEIEDARAADLP